MAFTQACWETRGSSKAITSPSSPYAPKLLQLPLLNVPSLRQEEGAISPFLPPHPGDLCNGTVRFPPTAPSPCPPPRDRSQERIKLFSNGSLPLTKRPWTGDRVRRSCPGIIFPVPHLSVRHSKPRALEARLGGPWNGFSRSRWERESCSLPLLTGRLGGRFFSGVLSSRTRLLLR